MRHLLHTLTGLLIGALLLGNEGCKKDNTPIVPVEKPSFSLTFDNQFNILEARYAAYLTDDDGKILAFRWLNPSDTSRLTLPDTDVERYDCTVAKVVIVETVLGLDTTIELTSYHQVADGSLIHLRNPNFQQVTTLSLQLTGLSNLDTIIVPDGLTFIRPRASNNFLGQYRVTHTGRIWLRLRFDGDSHWRYVNFDNISSGTLNTIVDVNLLPVILEEPPTVQLPFSAQWKYNLQGVINLNQRQFVAVGDLDRAPGGYVPVLNQLAVFRPLNQTFSGYRINLVGREDVLNGYTYYCDRLYDQLPTAVETPNFDLAPTVLGDSRLVAVNCSGYFDLLRVTRENSGQPHVVWTALAPPVNNGTFVHRLPDVPKELGAFSKALRNYEFGGVAKVRAERYLNVHAFDDLQNLQLDGTDPLWAAKAGLLGKERAF